MKKFSIIAILSVIFVLSSCSPFISIKVKKDNSVDVSFKTGFSEETAKILKTISGTPKDVPIFNAGDMIKFLTEAGAYNVSAKVPTENEIQASGNLREIKRTAFYTTEILKSDISDKKGKNKISFSLGSEQITKFYNLLDSNSKSYIDTMMIPALIGEEMSIDEYRMLLSAMYGPTFANELVDGKVTIQLESPNGKTMKFTEKLGDLLTLKSAKTWTLEY